jgi:hypothetical protein
VLGATNTVPLGDAGRCEGSTATLSVGNMEISVDGTLDGVAEESTEGWKVLKPSVGLITGEVSDDSVPDPPGTSEGRFEGR